MMPKDCPGWEYEDHPNHDAILPVKCDEWLNSLAAGDLDPNSLSCDTRSAHFYLFNELTPDNCEYYSGNYRGEDFKCLKFYNVHILSDARVGVDASAVQQSMEHLKKAIESGMAAINGVYLNDELPVNLKIRRLVKFATLILVEFLRIHPYANGNGHVARLIIFTLLIQHNHWPKSWPFDDSPPYHRLIADYRNGVAQPLEDFILKSILDD